MGAPENSGLPTSWRDVHTLVRDSSERIEGKLDQLSASFNTHLLDHARADGLTAGERQVKVHILGVGRATVALLVSIAAGIASLASLFTMVR